MVLKIEPIVGIWCDIFGISDQANLYFHTLISVWNQVNFVYFFKILGSNFVFNKDLM